MLDEYYDSRGWDVTGKPMNETLEKLELTGVLGLG
jgi:aldehyde:ferredoxin oxidoreductase